MNIYTLYIEDDRYQVPSLLTVELAGDPEAMAHVDQLFARSAHYQAIEIWEEDRRVGRAVRPDAARS
ncbi:MAG TPA: hypothetical protein VMU59_08725 [Caulobacteraceae bacterium]|nr:hypothetical protein [Caulobacteraceae bacterium]